MTMITTRRALILGAASLPLASALTAVAKPLPIAVMGPGFQGATLLIVRHAEKPVDGMGLTPAGQRRAQAYANYFTHFTLDGAPIRIDALAATLDSPKSARPRLTLEPLAKATGMPLQTPFADKQVSDMAGWVAHQPPGRTTLIAWHHGQIPNLLAALGADPGALIPGGVWPNDVYDWVVVLRYDSGGKLVVSKVVHEPQDLNT